MFISSDISADELTIHSPHMQFRYLPIVAALMLAFSGSSTQAETYSHTYDQQDISGNIEIDVDSVPIYSDVDLTIRDSTVEGYVAVGDFNAASNGSATISISDSSLGSLFVSGPDREVTANNLHISQATHSGTSAFVKRIGIV